MNVYILCDMAKIVSVHGRFQGAELARMKEARKTGDWWREHGTRPDEQAETYERKAYDRMRIETQRVQDED